MIPIHKTKIGQKTLVTDYFGGWSFLEDGQEYSWDDPAELYKSLNRNLFMPPSLHMLNVTDTCTNRCRYCHAGVSRGSHLMDQKVALKALDFIFVVSGTNPTIEFQGVECLKNWDIVKMVSSLARERNKVLKNNLHICAVSNLSLMDEKKLRFFDRCDVDIGSSLDGPKYVHDKNRLDDQGMGTFDLVVSKIRMINDYYKEHEIDKSVSCLTTVTKMSLPYPEAIVDTYISLGLKVIHLRTLNTLGDALERLPDLTYSADEFLEFWKKAMLYIIQKNKNGVRIQERGAANILCKILRRKDPLYVEMMSPSGMGRSALMYNHDGDIYSSDEGRMLKEDLFRIGSVSDDPKKVLGSLENLETWKSSIMLLYSYFSPFGIYAGLHPVRIHQTQGTIIPSITQSLSFKVFEGQCRYLFELIQDDTVRNIFYEWTVPVVGE